MQAAGSQEGIRQKNFIQLKDEIVKSCACSTAPAFPTIVV
jgi:hypothetical protein